MLLIYLDATPPLALGPLRTKSAWTAYETRLGAGGCGFSGSGPSYLLVGLHRFRRPYFL